MGHLFVGLGLLSKTAVVIKSASQMQTGYVGQAGNRTREILREARGGVLLIGAPPPLTPPRAALNPKPSTRPGPPKHPKGCCTCRGKAGNGRKKRPPAQTRRTHS